MYSVIIPSVGRINFLNDLLSSIYNQTILPKEIIILLDKNNTCREGLKLINKKDNCEIIFCSNLTTPEKRNLGVKNSKTDIILFSDDDDIWSFNKAELTLKSLKNYQVVCHEFSKFGLLKKKPRYKLGKKAKTVSILSLIHGNNIWGGGSGIAARKEILLSIPFNNDLYSEDYDWWIKVILAEIKIKYIPISLVSYRVHHNNMTSNLFNIFIYNQKIFNKIIKKSILLFFAFILGSSKSILIFLIKSLAIFCSNLLKIILKKFLKS